MADKNRLITVVLEVADLDRSVALFRDGFGLELEMPEEHRLDDRWIGGRHSALSWYKGAFLHFALYQAKGKQRTTGVQIAFGVDDLIAAHAKALVAGATLIHAPRSEPWGATSRYYDFDGNAVSLTQNP
jgi:predicted enzyme related to lactoylglutathione lyase